MKYIIVVENEKGYEKENMIATKDKASKDKIEPITDLDIV